jgi:hypothetical protein
MKLRGVCSHTFMIMLMVHTVNAARPFVTSDAEPVQPPLYEIEMGSYFWSDDASLVLEFKHGLTDRMDMGIVLCYIIEPEQEERFGTAEMGFKFGLIPGFLAFGISSEYGMTAYKVKGIVTKYIGPFKCNGNIGYKATGIDTEAGMFYYSVGAAYKQPMYQAGGDIQGDTDGLYKWLIGGNYRLTDAIRIDAGISGGFDEDDDNLATIGITYEY